MKDEQSEPTVPNAKQADASKGQEANASILAQYHAAEYSVLMGRVSSWESLQYAAWPILLAALALLAQMEDIDANYRWWAALISFLVVYVAYQSTMVNMLFYVLVVERDLRPIAGQFIGHENFWVHERARKNKFPSNPAWAMKWPILISIAVIVGFAAGVVWAYGVHWYDGACLILSLALLYFIVRITKNGERLKGQIRAACRPEVEHASRTGSNEVHAPATGAEVSKKAN